MKRSEARALRDRTDLPVAIQREVARVLAPRRDSPARNARKKAKREGRREGRSELRAQAMEREGGECPVCRGRGVLRIHQGPLHMHHVLRKEELPCVVMLCFAHHDERSVVSVHANHPATLRALAAYCAEHDMPEAARHLAKRIAKAEDTQRILADRQNSSRPPRADAKETP